MDKEITIVLDKCHEQLMQWGEDYMYEGMIVSVLGEGLPSYPAEPYYYSKCKFPMVLS